jgi:elongation factor Tu
VNPGQNLVTCVYCHSSVRVSAEAGAEPTVERVTESPEPTGSSFQMTVEDVFSIRNRGTVVTGRVASGTLHVGDKIFIRRGNSSRPTTIAGIEMFRKTLDQAAAGDNVGLLLKDVGSNDVQRGDVLSAEE